MNYLALIGWSPGDDDELLPIDELARRFSLERVGHSAGVFDEEKLAWVNRHYLKMADPRADRGAVAAVFRRAPASAMTPDARGLEFLASAMADGDARRSTGSIRCRRGWRCCSTTTRTRRSAMPALRDGDERRRRARGGRARWPRSWRRRRGSIASGSARSPTR